MNKRAAPANHRKGQKKLHMIHVGKRVPKVLTEAGWEEVSGIHLGKGCWILRLEKAA